MVDVPNVALGGVVEGLLVRLWSHWNYINWTHLLQGKRGKQTMTGCLPAPRGIVHVWSKGK